MWSFNTTCTYNVHKEPGSGTHIEVLNHLHLPARFFLQLCSSKRSFSSQALIHTSLQHPCTRHSLAVRLPRNFQYTPKQWFLVLLGVKRTSDSSSVPQHCLGNIYSSLTGHLLSHETSNNRVVRGATFPMYFSIRTYSHVFVW